MLRDAGLSYGDYLEQLTFLLFLKMMHERSQPPFTLLPNYQPPPIPNGYDWPSLLARDGIELEIHYRRTLEELGRQPGTLGVIFNRARNEIQEPAMLTRLVKDLIDSETWLSLSADVKGDAYESLLERNAQDVKDRRRPILHPKAADPGHCGRYAPGAGDDHLRPCLRHRRFPSSRPRLHRPQQSKHESRPVGAPSEQCTIRLG